MNIFHEHKISKMMLWIRLVRVGVAAVSACWCVAKSGWTSGGAWGRVKPPFGLKFRRPPLLVVPVLMVVLVLPKNDCRST